MGTETESNKSHMMEEASTGAPVLSGNKSSCSPSQATQVNPGGAAIPFVHVGSISAAELKNIYSSAPRRPLESSNHSHRSCVKGFSPLIPPPKKRYSKKDKGQTLPKPKREKKKVNMDTINFDLAKVPSPFCSCTGIPRVCYKWGSGGWQSACCTNNISQYPLPISSTATKPGIRTKGRKMSKGVYLKLLLKLEAEGHDFSNPLDLKDHWARHGANKYVRIK